MPLTYAPGQAERTQILFQRIFASVSRGELFAATCLTLIAMTGVPGAGQIMKHGESVRVRVRPAITVGDYVPGTPPSVQKLTWGYLDINIDKCKYWLTEAFDVERAQTDMKGYVAEIAQEAGPTMATTIEEDFFEVMPATAHAANKGNAAGAKSGIYRLGEPADPLIITNVDMAWALLANERSVLAENNALSGRNSQPYSVKPEWFINMILRSKMHENRIGRDLSQAMLTKGVMFDFFGMKVIASNLLHTTDEGGGQIATSSMFGDKGGSAFITQLSDHQSGRGLNGDPWATYQGALELYGYGVYEPKRVGRSYIVPNENA